MWMGGVPPLGYQAQHRKLVIVDSEAEIVRFIFRRYAVADKQCRRDRAVEVSKFSSAQRNSVAS